MSEQSRANKRELEIEIEKLKKIRREEAFLYYSGMTNEKPSTLSHQYIGTNFENSKYLNNSQNINFKPPFNNFQNNGSNN